MKDNLVNESGGLVNDCISRQAAIDALDIGCELLKRALDDTDVVGVERAKYEWGLGLIESYIADIKELPSAQPECKRECMPMYADVSDCISRQDAIDALGEKPLVWDDLSDFDLGKAAQWSDDVDAIKALPSTQPQPCKDAVSKADVLETYAELYDVFDDNKEIKNELHKIYDKINALQAAQPQRIKGRWRLLPGRDDEHIRYLHCSVCHFNGDYESNFCPNCGADMRGDEDAAD